jgi:protein required for attachment to host cells
LLTHVQAMATTPLPAQAQSREGMMKPTRTWVVVADGARARLFAHIGAGTGLEPVADGVMEGSRAPERELGTDAPGRAFDSIGGQRHAVEPRVSLHDAAETAFLKRVVQRLAASHEDGAFDRLVVIAAPRALGELRRLLPASVAETLDESIAKDLTRAPLDQIEREAGFMVAR